MTSRRGFTVIEMAVAITILAVAMTAIAYLVRVMSSGIRADREWTAVSQMLDATMESLVAQGHARLVPVRDKAVPVPSAVAHRVPDLVVTATVESAGAHLTTITLKATWRYRAGRPPRNAQLKARVAARRRKGGAP